LVDKSFDKEANFVTCCLSLTS